MADIKHEIKKDFGVIEGTGDGSSKWKRHLTLTSWNDAFPKYDIRSWDESMDRCNRGLTFTLVELKQLKELIDTAIAESEK